MKQIKITIPDNCELKQNGNIYTIVEKEELNYDTISDYLEKKGSRVITFNVISTPKQSDKIIAITQLMNVAKYLNGNWQPDWTYAHERGWYILIRDNYKIEVSYSNYNCGDIYFRTEKLAKEAIEILGEETIKLALCTDY